ncbi:MAG: DUF7144 family membrane protein [Chloroflexota bacterium]
MATRQPSGFAVGWIAFAGIMMILSGGWWIIAGLVAIFNSGFYVVTQQGYFLQFDVTTWGWIQLGFGIVLVAAGFGVFSGALWARVVGVILAGLAALAAFAWLPYYPIWAFILIAISVIVIWALAAHGRDVAEV